MEIKKSLLNAMLVGLTVASVSSCGMFDQIDEDTQPTEIEEGRGEEGEEEGQCWLNCAACGMG